MNNQNIHFSVQDDEDDDDDDDGDVDEDDSDFHMQASPVQPKNCPNCEPSPSFLIVLEKCWKRLESLKLPSSLTSLLELAWVSLTNRQVCCVKGIWNNKEPIKGVF